MSTEQGSIIIAAAREVVRNILLQPLHMPAWNPAFRSVEGPVEPSTGVEYSLRTAHEADVAARVTRSNRTSPSCRAP